MSAATKLNQWITNTLVGAARKQAERWQNRYWLSAAQRLDPGDTAIGPGVYDHGAFKTKDDAEIAASKWMKKIESGEYVIEATIIYLGAFPIETRDGED